MLANFPEFQQLEPQDRTDYENQIESLEPYSDICMSTLRIWWDYDNKLAVSSHLGNLIINYYQPFDEDNKGLALIGTQDVTEAAKDVFKFLEATKQPVKLIHVPDFTADLLSTEEFEITEEREYSEYILDSQAVLNLEGSEYSRLRRKVGKFKRETEDLDLNIEVGSVDLSDQTAQESLFNTIVDWERETGRNNDPEHNEHDAIKRTLALSSEFNIANMCLFVNGKVQAVILYEPTQDGKYYIVHHLKVNYTLPHVFEYMSHKLAEKAVENNVPYLNYEMDLGIESLRQFKMGLRPVRFTKKYTVTAKTPE